MSKVYRIHGARFLRKYTAAEKSSNYAYMADVRKIADTLCKVPWTRVSGDVAATTTIHAEEGIDWNEPERDRFDAAEWCGEHADGFHRAFAQAACYVFKLPASAVGKAIEKIRVNVTSDPYNPYGARIAAMTSATLEIPMDCQTVREGEVFRAPDDDGMGAAPRLYRTNQDGTQTWYANSEIVELEPGSTLTAKQYLFVFVALENYNRGRDGWIEGSSYIDNDVELTLSAAASDLVEDEINDLSQVESPKTLYIVKDGVIPDMVGSVSGVVASTVTASGTSPEMDGNIVMDITQLQDEISPVNNYAGIRAAYAKLFTGSVSAGVFGSCHESKKRLGIGFCVKQGTHISYVDGNGASVSPRSITLTASSMFVPFSLPSWKPYKVNASWHDWLDEHNPTSGVKFAFYIKPGVYVTEYDLAIMKSADAYMGRKSVSGWSLLGVADVSDGDASFDVNVGDSNVATLFVCAYIPQDGIANSTGAFAVGTADIWYNGITPDGNLGGDVIDDYSASVSYSLGDKVRMSEYGGRETFKDCVSAHNGCNFCYKNGIYLASAKGILYSRDGESWNGTDVISSSEFSFEYGNGVWIASPGSFSTGDRVVYRSTDGVSWSPVDQFSPTGQYVSGLVFFKGRFYIHIAGNGVYSSEDGMSWSMCKSTTEERGLNVAGGNIYVGGKIVSADGVTWNNLTGTTYNVPTGLVVFKGITVISSTGGIVSSGSSGSGLSSVLTKNVASLSCNSSVCVAAVSDMSCGVMYSTDGVNWNETGVGEFGLDVKFFNGAFYASTIGGVYRSTNGVSWSKIITGVYVPSPMEKRIALIKSPGDPKISYPILGDVYECKVANSTVGSIVESEWQHAEEEAPERMHGAENLCVPDISIVG